MVNSEEPPPIYVDEFGTPITDQQITSPIQAQVQENIIKYQLETFEDMTKLMRIFRGELYDPDKRKWEKKGKAMMNETGITDVISFVMEGKNILLSNYTREELYKTIRALLNTLSRMIYNNHMVYSIKDTASADTIIDIAFNHMQAMFLSAEGGDMRTALQKQVRESHTYISSQPQQQKKRMWNI